VALTIGIVGLPNAGKSTLFNALTKNDVLAANYPFATIEPNVGVVGVPDKRLDVLTEMFHSAKTIPATVSFVDIAGIVKGASKGEGMGNEFLSNIREADAICQVTRCFADDDVTHVNGHVDPSDDIETITTELVLADLQTMEKQLPKLQKEAAIKKESRPKVEAWEQAKAVLEEGKTIFSAGLDPEPLHRGRRSPAHGRFTRATPPLRLLASSIPTSRRGSSRPRWCPSTTLLNLAAKRRPRLLGSCGWRARSTLCRTVT